MKRFILTILLIGSTAFTLLSQQTIRRQYEFSPVVSVNLYLLKSDTTVPHGKFTQFFRGKRWVEGEYSYGEKTGKWKRFYQSGRTMVEGEFANGKPHGKWTRYNGTGEVLAEIEYENGFPTGVWKGYYNAC